MRRALKRIADAIHDFVTVNNWDLDSYRLYYRADEVWNHIYVVFVAPEFEPLDYYSGYLKVMKYLKEKLQDEPGLFESVGLVVRDPKRFEEIRIGPEFEDVATEFEGYRESHQIKG